MDETGRARWMVLAAALSFSTGGAVIKLCGWQGLQVAGGRSLLAAFVLLALVPETRGGWTRRTALVSVAYAMTLFLFVLSNKMTTAANAIILQSTSPFYVLLLSPRLLGETRRRDDVVVIGVMAVGMSLFAFSGDSASAIATNPGLGNTLALASGLSWAFTVMGFRWLSRHGEAGGAESAAVMGNLLVAAVALPWVGRGMVLGGPVDWACIAWLGAVQIGLSYILVSRGMRKVDALEASILLMAEPALSPFWAWWVHGERPAPFAVAGGVVLIGALVGRAIVDRARRVAVP